MFSSCGQQEQYGSIEPSLNDDGVEDAEAIDVLYSPSRVFSDWAELVAKPLEETATQLQTENIFYDNFAYTGAEAYEYTGFCGKFSDKALEFINNNEAFFSYADILIQKDCSEKRFVKLIEVIKNDTADANSDDVWENVDKYSNTFVSFLGKIPEYGSSNRRYGLKGDYIKYHEKTSGGEYGQSVSWGLFPNHNLSKEYQVIYNGEPQFVGKDVPFIVIGVPVCIGLLQDQIEPEDLSSDKAMCIVATYFGPLKEFLKLEIKYSKELELNSSDIKEIEEIIKQLNRAGY